MRPVASVLALACVAGCSYTSYTPPARMMPLETAVAPPPQQLDVQSEVSMAGAIFGFNTYNGALRVREGVTDNLAVTAEGGVTRIDGNAAPGTPQNAYVGRVGVHLHMADREPGLHVALTAGVGGGASSLAGRWISEDVGLIVSGNGAWVAPFASIEGFASQPIDAQPFTYEASGDAHPDVLTRSAGFRIISGLEFRDGTGADSKRSFLIGGMTGGIYKRSASDGFAGLGAALRLSW
jgi:hypothetical protein